MINILLIYLSNIVFILSTLQWTTDKMETTWLQQAEEDTSHSTRRWQMEDTMAWDNAWIVRSVTKETTSGRESRQIGCHQYR